MVKPRLWLPPWRTSPCLSYRLWAVGFPPAFGTGKSLHGGHVADVLCRSARVLLRALELSKSLERRERSEGRRHCTAWLLGLVRHVHGVPHTSSRTAPLGLMLIAWLDVRIAVAYSPAGIVLFPVSSST